uniref:Uncharacterized protein n=1 Tax=Wuchereria bancrofti TaxID=6293 RepID=A0AAF5PJB2_WUCBA
MKEFYPWIMIELGKRAYRMHLAQKELKKLRLDVDKKTKAAYIIQSYYRGYVSRKSDRNTNEQQSTGEKVTEERNSNKSLKILTNVCEMKFILNSTSIRISEHAFELYAN